MLTLGQPALPPRAPPLHTGARGLHSLLRRAGQLIPGQVWQVQEGQLHPNLLHHPLLPGRLLLLFFLWGWRDTLRPCLFFLTRLLVEKKIGMSGKA